MFVDRVVISVKAGDGGRGMCSFRREKYVPRGGPSGGDGGHGGSVIIRAVHDADNLAPLVHRRFWKAEKGEPGGTSLCHGSNGGDLVILVPPGTIIKDKQRGNILKDLVEDGDEVVVAQGGRGGRGNKAFATATNRAPREFEPGGKGEERELLLELKVIADVGVIGLPNAGKSTLLSRLSRATPEIADYPFTTKYPNLGIVNLGGDAAFVMADLPGLIEGAAAGIGLGHEFLRHVERTRILVHLLEPFPTDGSSPIHNYQTIRKELANYSLPLSQKLEVVALSKSELVHEGLDLLVADLQEKIGKEVFAISGVTGQGLAHLIQQLNLKLIELKLKESEEKKQELAQSHFSTGPHGAVRVLEEPLTATAATAVPAQESAVPARESISAN